jgi:RNA polymerase sigma-70 factor (ECF subfamily)
MDLKATSDEELVLAFQQKDLQALEEFFDRHQRIALAVAYRVLGDREAAEDVLQEAFLAVWRQADTYQPEKGTARSWFLSIVRHRAIDVTRGRSFAKERISLDELNFEPRYSDVWQQVDARLDGEQVRQAVEALPAEQKEAVLLAYFGGFTHPEIAQRTGVPLGTVKGRLRLAMQKLRNLLADIDTGGLSHQ